MSKQSPATIRVFFRNSVWTLQAQATGAVVASWEPGDDICPPWPKPWPWPFPPPPPQPDPIPWEPIASAAQVELAHVLVQLSGLTTSKEFNGELKSMAAQRVQGVAGTLADDFEKCGTVPRPPFPPRR